MLPDVLKEKRREAKLTQAELAKKIGVSRSSVYAFEAGTREPSNETLVKISNVLGCSVDYLLTGHSGLVLKRSDEREVEINEFYDDNGNVIDVDINLNTMLTGNDEKDKEFITLLEDYANRPGMRMLFKLAHDATEEDVQTAARIIEALRKEE